MVGCGGALRSLCRVEGCGDGGGTVVVIGLGLEEGREGEGELEREMVGAAAKSTKGFTWLEALLRMYSP